MRNRVERRSGSGSTSCFGWVSWISCSVSGGGRSRIRISYQSERHNEVTKNCRPFILISRDRICLVREIIPFFSEVSC